MIQECWWRGYRSIQTPADMMALAEVVHATRPDLIVETGTRYGGTALYLADVCAAAGHGEVVTIDVEAPPQPLPWHPLLKILREDSVVHGETLCVAEGARIMVTLDSDHSYDHVLRELRAWAPHVTVGCYLVVQDVDLDGPREALEYWLAENEREGDPPSNRERFEDDPYCDRFGVSRHAWLRRVA